MPGISILYADPICPFAVSPCLRVSVVNKAKSTLRTTVACPIYSQFSQAAESPGQQLGI